MRYNHKAVKSKKDHANIQQDGWLQLIAGKTAEEIEQYFDNNTSQLAKASDQVIDDYVDGLSNLADVKVMLKALGKDSSFNSNMLKRLTKVISLLTQISMADASDDAP